MIIIAVKLSPTDPYKLYLRTDGGDIHIGTMYPSDRENEFTIHIREEKIFEAEVLRLLEE